MAAGLLHVPDRAWLFSRRADLWSFAAPALLALVLVPLGPAGGELPLPGWVVAVLLVDVAHVWATIYRTYLDPELRVRRRGLLLGAPLAAYAVGVLLHQRSAATFWTCLAYLAAWHFVRQQYGWVALLHRKEGAGPLDRALDTLTIYAATLGPLLWWHASLPRRFDWFVSGDFADGLVPPWLGEAAVGLSSTLLLVFVLRQVVRAARGEGLWLTKVVVVLGTFACWHVGIVLTDSDWAFTVTNVLIHGVPYFVLVWRYGRRGDAPAGSVAAWVFGGARWAVYYAVLVALAWAEELGWDRLVWHEHGQLFPGPEVSLSAGALALLVPLLALPQAVHYVLDAFIWRRAEAR